jgi:hypothetical protein
VDICLRFQREEILKALCPNEVPQSAVKRLPSQQFPMEASCITKEVGASLEASLNGSYDARALGYLQLNFAVPCEIRSFSEEARRAIMMEIVDVDARDTLEDEREPVINWSCLTFLYVCDVEARRCPLSLYNWRCLCHEI